LSALKSHAYPADLAHNELLITADTVVILGNDVLGKPKDEAEAHVILRQLSGNDHYVVTGVTLRMRGAERTFSSRSRVRFAEISDEIKQAVDYIVGVRQDEPAGATPSSIIKLGAHSEIKVIRE
jgi:septum formation protein